MIHARAVTILCVASLILPEPYSFAQAPQPAGTNNQSQTLSAAQLDSLVAPIALYPDPILSQVLVASTYPLEIVAASRWLAQQSNLKGKALADAAAKQPWDASVQAMVMLPDVLNRLNQNISWTGDLGNAFLAQEQGVMDAVQRLRRKAQDAGALQSTQQQTVSSATENNATYIEIQPADPQVVYVPQYNPVAVWGPPPAYYPYPPIYYPPVPSTGAIIAASAISFGAGMAIGAIWGGGWGGWGWGCGWGRGSVTINNNFISSNHFNRVNVGNGNRWVHNPAHRGGMAYNNRNVANRYGGANRFQGANRPNRPGQGNLGQGANRPNRPGQGNLGQGANRRPGQGNLGQGANRPNRPGQGNLGQGANRPNRPGQGNLGQRGPGRAPSQGSASRVSPNAGRFGNGGNRNPGGGHQGFANRSFGGGNRGGGGFAHRGGANRGGGGGRARGGGGGRRR
jgi:Protein of unknown function (DUF3300)